MSETLLIAFAVAVIAGLMRGFAGVGSGMLMAPIFAVLFGPVDTVAIIICMELVVTAQLLPSVYREIDWRVVLPMGLVAALFMPLGTRLLVTLDAEVLSRGIGWVVLVFVVLMMTGYRYLGPKRLAITLGVGGVSGVLMASTSLGNPPVIMYLLSGRDGAASNRANFTGYFAVTLIILIALVTYESLISRGSLQHAAMLLPAFMATAWIGSRLFRKSSEAMYRRVTLGLLCVAGLYGVVN
jgi:uncharacterized membrane protein YfcA